MRYLRPPTPPPPGEIIIKLENNLATPPAPPLVIRQQPPRPDTPEPLIIREAPPKPPKAIGQRVVVISGKRLPPPPRKVVIERLPPIPNKPQSFIIERWLPYKTQRRKVVFQKNIQSDPIVNKPKNVIIQWEAPKIEVKKQFKDLGVMRANPLEYVQKFGSELISSDELPYFVKDIRPPKEITLASEHPTQRTIELEGDLYALNLIDLYANGLSEYEYMVSHPYRHRSPTIRV